MGSAGKNEVDFVRPFAPVVQVDGESGRVVEVRPHRAFHDPAPEGTVGADLLEGTLERDRHQGRVEDVQLRTRSAGDVSRAGVARQSGDQPGARQQVEVVGKRRGVPGLLQLAQHLVVGQDLAGILGAQLHQAAHQRGLLYPAECDDIPLDAGRDDGSLDGGTPGFQVADLFRHPRIPAEEKVLFEAETKRRCHLGVGPMAHVNGHEAASETLVQSGQHRPWCRPRHDDSQWAAGTPVPVPLSFRDQRPLVHVLDFIEGQHKSPFTLLGVVPRPVPGVQQPRSPPRTADLVPLAVRVAQDLIYGDVSAGKVHSLEGVVNDRGLPRLTGSGERHDQGLRLAREEVDELVDLGALVGMHGVM